MLAEHDDRSGTDEAAVRLQRVEIQRDVGEARRHDPARGAAGQVRVKLVTRKHSAAELVDQLLHSDACGSELDAGLAHPAAHAERTKAVPIMAHAAAEP